MVKNEVKKVEVKKEEKETDAKKSKAKAAQVKKTQREIVYVRALEVVKEKKIVIKNYPSVLKALGDEDLETLHQKVFADFKSGEASLKDTPSNKEKLANEDKLMKYVIGLCSNWLNRDTRLNGEEKA
jgi:hypothetical protein